MAYAEKIEGNNTHTGEQTGQLAYLAGTHILSPNGSRTLHFTSIEEASLEAAHAAGATHATNPLDEVAWMEFYTHTQPRQQGEWLKLTDEPLIAIDFQDEAHQFAPLSELLEDPSLPFYTAEWLARYMRHSHDYSLKRSGRVIDPRFHALATKTAPAP